MAVTEVIVNNGVFYLLKIDDSISLYASLKDAIKSLRNILKADLLLKPAMVAVFSVDIGGGYQALEIPMAYVVRGMTWADGDYPVDWP